MEEKLIITVTKKGSDEIVVRIFTDDDGELKAIVDDEYDVTIKDPSR
jgi:hypothetical protein